MIAYSGVVDAGTGELLKKSLKGIAAQKTNPGQVGYSAEVLSTARRNAEHIISGDSARAFRTDDITPRVDKKFGDIGGVNETRYDVAEIRGGRISEAVQVKFVGNNAKECLTLLHSAEFRTKYFSQGIKIEIPADYYDEVLRLDPSLRGSITKSSVTKSEALQAVRSPMMTTARNVAGVSHRAGLEGAGYGAGISGGISAVRNICVVISGDKDAGEALGDVVKDTACGAAVGYAVNFGVSAVSRNAGGWSGHPSGERRGNGGSDCWCGGWAGGDTCSGCWGSGWVSCGVCGFWWSVSENENVSGQEGACALGETQC